MNKNRLLVLLFAAAMLLATLSGCVMPLSGADPSGGYTLTPEPGGEDAGLFVTIFDVGQADMALVKADGRYMLIDAGDTGDDERVLSLLEKAGVDRFDIIVGTHPHADHIGCMAAVVKKYDFDRLLMPDAQANTRTFEKLLDAVDEKNKLVDVPEPGDELELGGARVSVVAPGKEFDDLNDMSIVLRVTYGNRSILFTGDAEKPSENLQLKQKMELKADVLKAGHHGSVTSSSKRYVEAVRPEYAVISCGEANSYGHPHKETLDRLGKMGINILRTDLNGTVSLSSNGETLEITTER